MICPKKFNSCTTDSNGIIHGCYCEKEQCAWWNDRFEKCCIAVEVYLKGVEDMRKEAKERYNAAHS